MASEAKSKSQLDALKTAHQGALQHATATNAARISELETALRVANEQITSLKSEAQKQTTELLAVTAKYVDPRYLDITYILFPYPFPFYCQPLHTPTPYTTLPYLIPRYPIPSLPCPNSVRPGVVECLRDHGGAGRSQWKTSSSSSTNNSNSSSAGGGGCNTSGRSRVVRLPSVIIPGELHDAGTVAHNPTIF